MSPRGAGISIGQTMPRPSNTGRGKGGSRKGTALWAAGVLLALLLAGSGLSITENPDRPASTPLASVQAPPAATRPTHIMSMMLCNDLLLLMLVPPERIASITYLAHDAVQALMPGADRGVAINHGTAEEILLQAPDLILTGTYSTPMARKLAKKVGARVVEVEAASSFDDIRRIVRRVGEAVGEPERAEALLHGMDATLDRLAVDRPAVPLRVVAWSGTGVVPGKGTLTHAIISASGADNIAALVPDDRYGSFGLEELLQADPDVVLRGANRWSGASLHDSRLSHPLIDRYWRGRQISFPEAAYACGLPQSADAAVTLRTLYRELPGLAEGP